MSQILQFGGGRFLRGFIDRFLAELGCDHSVTVVTSTPGPRANLVNDFVDQGYPVFTRGIENGQTIDRRFVAHSLRRGIVAGGFCDRSNCYAEQMGQPRCEAGSCFAAEQWTQVLNVAGARDLSLIVSNVTEAGMRLDDADHNFHYGTAPVSYPAKLCALLYHRWRSLRPPLPILPCELVERNGDTLRELVVQQAMNWRRPGEFLTWIKQDCRWINNLVDCIVVAPSDDSLEGADHPLAVQIEPYTLLAVEGDVPEIAPFTHDAVVRTDDLTPFYLRKVRILNGLHTAMVAKYLNVHETVRDVLADSEAAAWLKSLLDEEIVPAIADRVADVNEFAAAVLDRFANPFLAHKLADIALNHGAKLETRLRPTLEEYRAKFGKEPEKLASIFASSS